MPIIVLDGDDYIRFYAQPSGKWEFVNGHYIFEQNVYTDESYVYLTFNGTNAKNIKVKASGEGLYSKKTIDYFYDVVHHERDEVNFIASGRLWFGNEFRVNSNQTFNHSFKEVKVSLPGDIYAPFCRESNWCNLIPQYHSKWTKQFIT